MSRLARALNSSDLSEAEYLVDSDVLKAAALSQVRKGSKNAPGSLLRDSLGMMLSEARHGACGDSSHAVARIKDVQQDLELKLRKWSMRWPIRVTEPEMAELLVRELLLDFCVVCQGRGFIPLSYTSVEEAAWSDCSSCLGSGQAKRDYEARAKAAGHKDYSTDLDQFWDSVLDRCTDLEIGAQRKMWKRLRNC
jgi:DnaJ-class molecular chaperone